LLIITHPSGVSHADFPEPFASLYRSHLQHLQLKGMQPKTIDACARAVRRIGTHFDFEVSALGPAQLADYFTQMKDQHSWSGVKLDLYGLKFFTLHVLGQPWQTPGFIRPPKTSRLPDIVSIEQAQAIFDHTRCLGYRWRDAKSGKPASRTLPGADFLWLLLQHVLPKGLQRARNFGFLHHNSRRALHLLQLLHLRPSAAQAPVDVPAQRPIWRCVCGGAMVVLRRRIKPDAVPPCTAPQTAQPDKRVPVEVTKH
jgi:hypothetical protein